MMKYSYKWAVLILSCNKYVTKVNNAEKMSYWEDGKPAKLMTRSFARDLAWALSLNGNNAVVVEVPDYIEGLIVNPEPVSATENEVENNG